MQNSSIGKVFKRFCQILALMVFPTVHALASGNSGEGFNAGDMIMHHVMDAHDIHLMTIGEGENAHDISIPLPIIIYSTEDGLSMFLSSAFHHGKA